MVGGRSKGDGVTGYWLSGIAGLIIGGAVAGGVQQIRVSHAQTALSDAESAYSKRVADAHAATAQAQAEARKTDAARADAERSLAETVVADAEKDAKAHAEYQKTVAAADAQSRSLREQLAALTARGARDRVAAGDAASAAAERDAARATVGMLAGMLAELDSLAGQYATAADTSRAAGLSCERAYGAARAATAEGSSANRTQ